MALNNLDSFIPEGSHSWLPRFTDPATVVCSRCGVVRECGTAGTDDECEAMECRICGSYFMPSDLAQVVFHEHTGMSEDSDLSEIPRGERVR